MAQRFGRRRYAREIEEHPILTREDEAALVRRVKESPPGDPIEHELILSNVRFVHKIAGGYQSLLFPFEDLVNEGNIGLIEAARHFDPARGTRFLTYAVWWIRKAMLRALARQSSLVQIPAYQMKRLRRVLETERRLSKALGRQADREEISREMRIALSQLDAILGVRSRELSLDEPTGPDTVTPRSAGLLDERSINAEDELIRHENEELVHWALGLLREEERVIIVSRFGLEGNRAATLKEIGARLGLSRERIRQIEVQARERLRKAIAGQHRPFPGPRGLRKRGVDRAATTSAWRPGGGYCGAPGPRADC